MRTALAASLLLLVVSCNGGSSPTAPEGNVPFTTVFSDIRSGVRVRRMEIISRASEWQAVWSEIAGGQSPQPPLPSVNFEEQLLIFVALGETPDACVRVAVEGVTRRDGVLHVAVKRTRPPSSCVCPPVVAFPVHVVSIPRAATGAEFSLRDVTEGPGCN